jgi:hypothetical protein
VAANDYHFVTTWRVRGTCEDVYDIIAEPVDLPRWWPAVYLSATELGNHAVALHTRGWLPYTLRWTARRMASKRPWRIAIEASGDFVGLGEWSFARDGDHTIVTFDWLLRAEKRLLRWLSWLLKPVFSWNHRWAMARGEECLRAELARRSTMYSSSM